MLNLVSQASKNFWLCQGLYNILDFLSGKVKNVTSLLLASISTKQQSSKLAGSPKSEACEIMLRTSETILALVQSD